VAVERMMHLLENVLVIGRHDAGPLEFRPRPLAITPFCSGLIEKLSSTMVTALNPNPQHCRQPVVQRIQVFGPCKPRALFCNRAARRVVAQGHGPGIGIPMTDQAYLFESFYRASNVGQVAGTGLGLTIVKDAVDCHNGRVQVQSQECKGSSFTVFLPVSVSPAESLAP
jgi:hypothetical protein